MTTEAGSKRTRVRARIRLRLAELDRQPVWLAKVLNVDLSLVSRWLSGDKPIPDERLREIAIALHRPPQWFLEVPDAELAPA